MSRYTVYSLADTRLLMYHPAIGQYDFSLAGAGKISLSWSGDVSSHTTTADGSVVINRLRSSNGTVSLEVPQNSSADTFLRNWARYIRNSASAALFGKTTLTLIDSAGTIHILCQGVTPQKIPDRVYDRASTSVTWTMLAASITEY